ncbi:hypothetical protein ACEPAH_7786 [Sanghuangporus vaninii]
MFRQFQLDNSAFPTDNGPDSLAEPVAAYHMMSELHSSRDVVHESDAFGAFGAFDASFDEDMELRLFEYLYDAGSRQSGTDDASVATDASNNENTTGSYDIPSDSTSRVSPQSALPYPHPLNTPVESCYWANLNLASTPRISSSQTDAEDRGKGSSSSSCVVEPVPFLFRSDLALGELQVAENPFIALPLPSTEDPNNDIEEIEEKTVVPDEQVHRSPLTVSSSSESTRADSPLPITPLVEPFEASRTIPRHTVAAGSNAEVPTPSKGQRPADSLLEKKSPPECVSDDTSLQVEEGSEEVLPAAEAELVTSDVTSDAPSLTRAITLADPEEAASAPREVPTVDLEVAPEAPFPSSSQSADAQELRTFPLSQDTPSPKKRKRVAKAHATHELRALSTLPPERKKFSLPIRAGRAGKSAVNRIRNIQLESESCCHLAGENGFCQFRDSTNGGRRCMAELPKDDKVTRAHLAIHTDALGWREYSRRHPDWKPTCPWCNEPRTKFEQLTRHILDTHLLMFMEWCPCGGTNSRSNTKTNTGRHEFSDVHKVYLRKQAELKAVKKEDADDGQEEFVQGSSKGTKRRRRR